MSIATKKEPEVKLLRNGDVMTEEDGKPFLVAHYSRHNGHLEFESKRTSVEYYNHAVSAIGSAQNGTQPSNLVIRSFGIKGGEPPNPKPRTKKPKAGPGGDSEADMVRWYLANDRTGAIVRYGIYTDESGDIIRRDVRRQIERIVDERETVEDKNLKPIQTGATMTETGPVYRRVEIIELKDQIIARRATELTFTPAEVIGGFVPEEDLYESDQENS